MDDMRNTTGKGLTSSVKDFESVVFIAEDKTRPPDATLSKSSIESLIKIVKESKLIQEQLEEKKDDAISTTD